MNTANQDNVIFSFEERMLVQKSNFPFLAIRGKINPAEEIAGGSTQQPPN